MASNPWAGGLGQAVLGSRSIVPCTWHGLASPLAVPFIAPLAGPGPGCVLDGQCRFLVFTSHIFFRVLIVGPAP